MRKPIATLSLVVLASLGNLCTFNAFAQNASEASIQELLEVTQTAKMMDSMYANIEQAMRAGMEQAAAGRPLSDEQRRLINTFPARMAQVMREELSWNALRPGFVQIYRDTLTQEEVNGMLEFYKTPAGKAVIAKMPLIMQRSMQHTQTLLGSFAPRMQAAMEQAMREAGLQPPQR
jgi:uncharacterized protein